MGNKELIQLKISGFDVWLRTSTPDLGIAISTLGGELRFLQNVFPSEAEGLVIDAGGYIGTATMKLASLFPLAKIVVVEPSTDNLQVLRQNLAAYPNVHIIPAALMATKGSGVIKLN